MLVLFGIVSATLFALTDEKGAEHLDRAPVVPDEFRIIDRGYLSARVPRKDPRRKILEIKQTKIISKLLIFTNLSGEPGGVRSHDPLIKSQMLYH